MEGTLDQQRLEHQGWPAAAAFGYMMYGQVGGTRALGALDSSLHRSTLEQ
jgi:hypothetical protein